MDKLTLKSTTKNIKIYALFSTLIFITIGLLVLLYGHPHEDAYILYIYAQSFAEHNTFSYFNGGPPAEGATDFLWMLFIGLLAKVGLNVALAGVLLNAVGIFFITYIAIDSIRSVTPAPFLTLIAVVLIPISTIAGAAYLGFSTALYCAGVLGTFMLLYRGDEQDLLKIPFIGLLLGLLRPDGVIIGVVATLIALIQCPRSAINIYLRNAFICAALGAAYFCWRWWYFGHLLPLPLYVKGASELTFPGFSKNMIWVRKNFWIILVAGIYLAKFEPHKSRALLASLPVLTLWGALLFAEQSQNLMFRFQAPLTVIVLLWCLLGYAYAYQYFNAHINTKYRVGFWVAFLTVLLASGYRDTSKIVRKYYRSSDETINYMNTFPLYLSEHISNSTVIALTEAGRFGYWLPGKKYDLVGLNTPHTAVHGASVDYLQELNPDLIFIHTWFKVSAPEYVVSTAPYYRQSVSEFLELSSKQIEYLHKISRQGRISLATSATYQYLSAHADGYDLFLVRYRNAYTHLYAVKKLGDIKTTDFITALEKNFSQEKALSYFDVQAKIKRD